MLVGSVEIAGCLRCLSTNRGKGGELKQSQCTPKAVSKISTTVVTTNLPHLLGLNDKIVTAFPSLENAHKIKIE